MDFFESSNKMRKGALETEGVPAPRRFGLRSDRFALSWAARSAGLMFPMHLEPAKPLCRDALVIG